MPKIDTALMRKERKQRAELAFDRRVHDMSRWRRPDQTYMVVSTKDRKVVARGLTILEVAERYPVRQLYKCYPEQ